MKKVHSAKKRGAAEAIRRESKKKRGDGSRGGERSRLSRVKNGYDEEEEEGQRRRCGEEVNGGAAAKRRQQKGCEEVWVEVLEEMSSASRRRRRGDKCLLLVQLPDNYRQTRSRCRHTKTSFLQVCDHVQFASKCESV